MDEKMIRVWRFCDAPSKLQALSTNGGDEDWLAVVPKGVGGFIPWLGDNGGFGVSNVDEYPQPDGSIVFIGCHA